MKIGNVEINGFAALAPMAGVADRAFRELCTDFGAGYVITEMVSSKGVLYSNVKSTELMKISQKERPSAVQIFGCEPDVMAKSAESAMEFDPDIIDINMGCPAPKITGNGCGSALMKNPELCGKIVKAVSQAVDIPVTVKIRKGWNEQTVNAVEIAKICEDNGAKAITVHGRTREQQYLPSADWNIIKDVKKNVNIPVIGNGDILNPEDAAKMYEETGCDYIMVGRAALGNPWIFTAINAWLTDMRQLPPPSIEERLSVMIRHMELICKYKGESAGMREARKHVSWYMKGFKGAAELRNQASHLTTIDDLKKLTVKAYKIYLSSESNK